MRSCILVVFSEQSAIKQEEETKEGQDEEEEEKALGPLGLKQEGLGRLSKAQKRRDKKADKEKEREEEIRRQEEENRTGVRQLEQDSIKARLTARGLTIKEVSRGSRRVSGPGWWPGASPSRR